MTEFRARYREAGGHVHIRLSVGDHTGMFAYAGTITLRTNEWDTLRAILDNSGVTIETDDQ